MCWEFYRETRLMRGILQITLLKSWEALFWLISTKVLDHLHRNSMEIRSILSSNSSPWEYLALSSIQDCAVLRRNTKIKRVLPTEVHSAVFEIDVNVIWSFTWVWSVIKTKADWRWISFGMIFKFFSFLP